MLIQLALGSVIYLLYLRFFMICKTSMGIVNFFLQLSLFIGMFTIILSEGCFLRKHSPTTTERSRPLIAESEKSSCCPKIMDLFITKEKSIGRFLLNEKNLKINDNICEFYLPSTIMIQGKNLNSNTAAIQWISISETEFNMLKSLGKINSELSIENIEFRLEITKLNNLYEVKFFSK